MAGTDDLDVNGHGGAGDVGGGVKWVEPRVKETVRHQHISRASILGEATFIEMHRFVWGGGRQGREVTVTMRGRDKGGRSQ